MDNQPEVIYAYRRKGLDYFCTCDRERYYELSDKPHLFEVTVFYTAPPSKPEQGCCECGVTVSEGYALYCVKCVEPLFKKEWVSLTDDDIALLRRQGAHSVSDKHFRAIDALLKEKNNG